jgi:hypothetical protein
MAGQAMTKGKAMTDDEFREQVQLVTLALGKSFEARSISKLDAANISGAAMAQVLATALGPIASIERLRDIADLMEAQFLEESAAR